MPTLPGTSGVNSRSSRVAVSYRRRLTRARLPAGTVPDRNGEEGSSPPEGALAVRCARTGAARGSDGTDSHGGTMLNPFEIGSVNVLEVVTVALLAGAAALVLSRGRNARWARRAAAGVGLLALSRLLGILALQWLLWERQTAMVEKVRAYSWVQAGLWLLSTAGLVLLVVAVLTQRESPEPGWDVPYAEAQAVGGGAAERDRGVDGGRHRLLREVPPGTDLRTVADDLDRHVADLEPGLADQPGSLREQGPPRRTRELGPVGAEVQAEVTQPRRREQGVARRVTRHVGV